MVLVALDDLASEYGRLRRRQQEWEKRSGNPAAAILLLCSPEPDSICAARILTNMFHSDQIQYQIKPVDGYSTLLQCIKTALEQQEDLISIFLINCGGVYNLLHDIALESHVRIYMLDSHRPYDLNNVHHEQIVIMHDSLDANVTYPKPLLSDDEESDEEKAEDEDEDIDEVGPGRRFDDDDDEDEEEEEEEGEFFADENDRDENGEPLPKKRKKRSAKAEARAQARAQAKAAREAAREERRRLTYQERRRKRIEHDRQITQYYSGTSYGAAAAVLMYELASQTLKTTNQELWYSILGLTDHFLHERIAPGRYAAIVTHIATESRKWNLDMDARYEALMRKQRENGQKAQDALVTKVGHVSELLDYRFPQLRHWALYSSIKHSSYIAARFQCWTEKGKEKLRSFLTELGIRTEDAKQLYKVMSVAAKERVETNIHDRAADSRYNIPDVLFRSFQRQHTPTLSLTACDMVLSLCALLELPHHASYERYSDWAFESGFWKAWEALNGGVSANALITQGIQQSILLQTAMLRQASFVFNQKAISTSSGFRYVTLEEGADSLFLSRPLSLLKCANFLFECSIHKYTIPKPFVVASPIPNRAAFLVVGTMGTTLTPGMEIKNTLADRFFQAAIPDLPERDEEEADDDETEDERRARYAAHDPDFAKLRVKMDAFDQAIIEVQKEDLEIFLDRLAKN